MEIKTENTTTHYQIIGEGETLVLLHGWGHNWQTWHPVVTELSKKYQLVIPDLPGFGKSKLEMESWSSYQYAQWLEEFLRKVVTKESFFLLGHSFGGKIASIFASGYNQLDESGKTIKKNPDLKKLVILGSSGLPDPLPRVKKIKQTIIGLVPRSLKNAIPLSVKDKILKSQDLASDSLNSTEQQKKILKRIIRENISPELEKINLPTLIIWGKNDQETPLRHGQEFDQLIADSKIIIFDKSGHFPYVDETELFISTLKQFLQS